MQQGSFKSLAFAIVLTTTPAMAKQSSCPVSTFIPIDKLLVGMAALSSAPKGEYETSIQFVSRVKSRLGLGGNDTFSTLIKIPAHTGKYDADAATLTIPGYNLVGDPDTVEDDHVSPHRYLNGLTVSETQKSNGEYVGQNSFGAVARVTQSRLVKLDLLWSSNIVFAPREGAKLSVAPSDAKRLRENLYLRFTGTLESPYFYSSWQFSPASVDEPVDLTVQTYGLAARPVCASLVSDGRELFSWVPQNYD